VLAARCGTILNRHYAEKGRGSQPWEISHEYLCNAARQSKTTWGASNIRTHEVQVRFHTTMQFLGGVEVAGSDGTNDRAGRCHQAACLTAQFTRDTRKMLHSDMMHVLVHQCVFSRREVTLLARAAKAVRARARTTPGASPTFPPVPARTPHGNLEHGCIQ
jgi:hypothetical protein